MTSSSVSFPSPIRSAFAVLIARVVIPLWLGVGAVLKLVDGSPSHLPAALVMWLGGFGMDLRFVLELSIAVELVVVIVMVMLPGLARPVGIAMLAAFVPVLIGDLALGASSCGCFGAVPVPPWVTLLTDGLFLLILVFIAHGVEALRVKRSQPTWRVVAVGLLSVLVVAAAFGLTASPAVVDSAGDTTAGAASAPAEGYYLPEYDAWIGRPFTDLELAAWIHGLPDDLDRGEQYLLFYRLDCEHCHELMEVYFSGKLVLPTTAVAVPERGGFPTEGVQPFVCTECRRAELPDGVDWFFATPVLVKLVDGTVACAAEVSAANPTCLDVF